jgi:hypothetical protein
MASLLSESVHLILYLCTFRKCTQRRFNLENILITGSEIYSLNLNFDLNSYKLKVLTWFNHIYT